jgi:hypothetical protein
MLGPNAEEEPWADVNPTNPMNLIAVWQQDRRLDGAHARRLWVPRPGPHPRKLSICRRDAKIGHPQAQIQAFGRGRECSPGRRLVARSP